MLYYEISNDVGCNLLQFIEWDYRYVYTCTRVSINVCRFRYKHNRRKIKEQKQIYRKLLLWNNKHKHTHIFEWTSLSYNVHVINCRHLLNLFNAYVIILSGLLFLFILYSISYILYTQQYGFIISFYCYIIIGNNSLPPVTTQTKCRSPPSSYGPALDSTCSLLSLNIFGGCGGTIEIMKNRKKDKVWEQQKIFENIRKIILLMTFQSIKLEQQSIYVK